MAKTITEIPFERIEKRFRLTSYYFGAKWCPAVHRTSDGVGYAIRVEKSEHRSGNNVTTSYDYFDLDESGLVTAAPRGDGSEYNRKVRVIGLAEAVEHYAEPQAESRRVNLPF